MVVIVASSIALSAHADSPVVGKWKGSIDLDLTKIMAMVPPDKQADVKTQLAGVKKAQMLLTLKADGTFTHSAKNLPGAADQDATGTWAVKGDKVTMKTRTLTSGKKTDATETKTDSERIFTLSKDGKTLTTELPGGQGKLTYKKQ